MPDDGLGDPRGHGPARDRPGHRRAIDHPRLHPLGLRHLAAAARTRRHGGHGKHHGHGAHHGRGSHGGGGGASLAGGRPQSDGGGVNAGLGTHRAKATSYYPSNDGVEGGYVDTKGHKLNTLQDYLSGKAPYVSVALDANLHLPYGAKLRIPELEKKYGRPIEFRAVDTFDPKNGPHEGFGRIDICTQNKKTAYDEAVNGMLTLEFQ